MSLLSDFSKQCVLLDKTRKPDGEGGYITEWKDGVEFMNFSVLDTSMEARKAEKEGVSSVYTGLVNGDVPIEYGDYYRDIETGRIFRVTSNPDEKQAPAGASDLLKGLKSFTAERRDLPE